MTLHAPALARELAQDRPYDASRSPELVRVPPLSFLMVDGQGDPTETAFAEAVQALYGLSFTLKFGLKKDLGLVYRVGPLEGLWWADDIADFRLGRREEWRWTAMIVQPDAVSADLVERARGEVIKKRRSTSALERARLETYDEGLAGQVMHIGPYSAEGPTIDRLHAFIHELGYTFDGRRQRHHELYIGDPRRSAPEKLRTIVRQPVAVP